MVIAQQLPQTSRRRHKGHLDRGAAAVEMAFVMPLLIAMIVGIIDFSRIFNGEIQLSQAAREGARVAALGYSVDNVNARTTAALNNPAFQGNLSMTCALSTTGCISVDVVAAGGGAMTGGSGRVCTATDAADNYAQVTVMIPYTKILFGPGSLSQKAVMKCTG
jgi:Flp pilus assembly protein TadG